MKTDTTKLAAELRRYNSWRRGDETIDQPEPMILGKIIDNAAGRLEELERELADSRQWSSKLADLADDMRAELAAERAQIEANHKVTRIIEEMLYAERALADRLGNAFLYEWGPSADEALAAWKEARRA